MLLGVKGLTKRKAAISRNHIFKKKKLLNFTAHENLQLSDAR